MATIYGLIENPRKGNNLGPFLRCACAFGIETVVAIGYDKCAVEGSHGAAKHVQIVAFPTNGQAAQYLSGVLGCRAIIGLIGALPGGQQPSPLQITDAGLVTFSNDKQAPCLTSIPLRNLQIPPQGNIAVAFTKHRQELSLQLAEICDVFLHIPHHIDPSISPPRPLLDAEACFSILLHYLTQKAGYTEHAFDGHKFDIAWNGKLEREKALATERRSNRDMLRSMRTREAQESLAGTELFTNQNIDGDY